MNLAKILPPQPVPVLERERLIAKLADWEDKKLILVHAQAGQGKSTLAADYVRTLAVPFVWYNVDPEDDNPAVFLSCLGQAVQRAWPDRVPRLPPVPQDRYGLGSVQRGLGGWIGQVFGGLTRPSLIVLDDFTCASTSDVLHRVLKTLIDATPPHVRFMAISRMRPELELAKLRAAQALGELTGDDLRFTDAEVRDLFSAVFGMQLSENEAALINGTTEGWPAGLVLMREYLSALPPRDRAPALTDRRATGFRTHAFDYLAQEVFAHLTPALQRFLLHTSIADLLPVPLMELLTGLPRSAPSGKESVAAVVRELRNRNLFVTTMDDCASVIRYHALFREFLRKKLVAQTKPREAQRLYSLAAAYFRKNGDPVRGVDLLLASGQFEPAVTLIESCGEELIGRAQSRTLIRWIDALPLEHGDRPWFLLYRAVAHRFTDPRSALLFFDLALKGFRLDKTAYRRTSGRMLSLCGVIEACFYAGGNFKRMDGAASEADALLRQGKRESPESRARLLLALGTAYFFIGKLRQGADALRESLGWFGKNRRAFLQVQCAVYLAPCALYLGDFRQAREAVRTGFEALSSIPEETDGEAALTMARAMTALFEGSFDEAQECIDRCRALARDHDLEAFDFLSLDIGGWLKTACGEYTDAEALLQQCKNKGASLENTFFNTSAAHLLAVNYLHQNRPHEALAEAEHALTVRARSGSRLFHAVSLSVSGAVDVKLGRLAKAERELTAALALFRQSGAEQQRANVLLLLAMLSRKKRRDQDTKRFIEAGFRIGQERGFTYYYLLAPAEVADLARIALREGMCADYCRDLLLGRRGGKPAPTVKVFCLGAFKVFRRATRVRDSQWKSVRSKTLLKLLAAQDTYALPREKAMDALWPDLQPDAIMQNFNSMLYRLRRVLDGGAVPEEKGSCVLLNDGVVALNKDLVWADTGQFLEHLETAGRMKAKQQSETILDEYGRAISLYQGDFLQDEPYSEWTAPVRDRLRMLYLKALNDAAALTESLEHQDKTLAFREKIFSADPCDETTCRWLMTRYLSDGRRSEAIRTYERCQMAMRRDLDLEPDHQTRKLHRRIIGGE